MFKSLIATALLSFSIGSKSISTQEAIEYNSFASLSGSYNLRNSFSFDYDDFSSNDFDLVFEDVDDYGKQYINFFTYYDDDTNYYFFIYKINFYLVTADECELTFYLYNDDYTSFSFAINSGDVISDLDQNVRDLIITFRNSYSLSGDVAKLFNVFFTRDDNLYTTTYNGYYSFNNGLSNIFDWFFIHGSLTFNQKIYYGFTNMSDGVSFGSNSVFALYYNVQDNAYSSQEFSLPFNRNYISDSNLLISNGKMSLTHYNVLSRYGIFAYQRDTSYDDSDWKDLLFSVMDSPIYMISRLLNFEIFNINLYIALAGLLSIVIIVFCVRKFL